MGGSWLKHDEALLVRVEGRIRDGHQRIARQISRISLLQSKGADTRLAKEVLEILRASQVTYLNHRDLLRREIRSSSLQVQLINQARLAVAESKRLLTQP